MQALRLLFVSLALLIALPSHAATTKSDPRPVRILCKVIATSNLTLSGAQTIDSVSVVAGDVVCTTAQSNNRNAAYIVQSGAWLPVNPGIATGLEFYALSGTSNKNKVYGCDTVGAITWGTTSTTFTLKSSSGAAFDPASPGAIGGTTAAAGTFTTLTATASLNLPSGSLPATTAGTVKQYSGNGNNVITIAGTGDKISESYTGDAGSGFVVCRLFSKSLADDASLDIALVASSLGGWGRVIAPGPTGSVSGLFSFAADATTSLNGATYTSVVAADTDTNLCVFASGGALRVRNRLGSTQSVLVEICELITP